MEKMSTVRLFNSIFEFYAFHPTLNSGKVILDILIIFSLLCWLVLYNFLTCKSVPWQRNYRFFFLFVSSTTMLCMYVFFFCWVNISKIMQKHHCGLWKAFMKSPVSGILILYTFVTVWFIGGLTTFHLYLILTNQTTYENFRYRYHRKMNPYNRGYVRNIVEIFFSKIPSSRNNFRAKVNVDSSSIFATPMSSVHLRSPEAPKRNLDREGNRQAVAAEDFENIQSQLGSVDGLERSGTQPRRPNWFHKTNWQNTPDILMLAAEYGIEHGSTNREKHRGGY